MVPGADVSVMIVDDSFFMRKILSKMLEMIGCTVIAQAEDGVEAVAKYLELRPQVVFMDLVMPNKDGIEATREIVSLDKRAKVVMCSTLGHQDLIKAALDSGARDVVFKPYEVDNIKQVLDKLTQF